MSLWHVEKLPVVLCFQKEAATTEGERDFAPHMFLRLARIPRILTVCLHCSVYYVLSLKAGC